MNKQLLILIVPMLISSCVGKHNSNAQEANIGKAQKEQSSLTKDTLQVDLSNSDVYWKGTKMRGSGKHQGQIQLQDGYFLTDQNKLVGGRFTMNMNTIQVTDIPEHEPVPRKRFNDHMKSEDFFNTEKYPSSEFTITKINDLANDSILVSGNLTIKDITKSITFKAKSKDQVFSTKFTFDRFEWNIAYEGNWADKTLVDKDIELTIKLKIE
jgi:polyisoprenoid-binding protein YceI